MKKHYYMAYIGYNNLWESEFHNIVSSKNRVQDIDFNELKLKVNDTNKKDERTTSNFQASNPEDVINKVFLDKKLPKIEGHILQMEKHHIEIKLLSNKQSVEEVLIQKAVKTTIQILYDMGLFDDFDNADEVLKGPLFVERLRPD